jgi:hypothetical protein
MTRSRRAGLSRDEARQQPLYARMLGLQYLAPGGFLCFVFLEGAVALGILLALAELVSWWGVLVLPAMVAAMVKLNDVVAGALIRPAVPARTSSSSSSAAAGADTVRLSPMVIAQVKGGPPALRPAASPSGARETEHGADASALNGPPVTRQWTEDLDDRQQRARQSAARRYE